MNGPIPTTSVVPTQAVQRLELVVTNSHAIRAGSTARHSFGRAGGTVGSRGADWMLDDGNGQVEPIHCEIDWIDNHFCVRDRSGATRINDATTALRRGMEAQLRDGDVLHIGAYRVMVHLYANDKTTHDDMTLAQRTVGELLNESSAHLEGLADAEGTQESRPPGTVFNALDALAAEAAASASLDPLQALAAAQRSTRESAGEADVLDPARYGHSASQTQADHARSRFEAVTGAPRPLSGETRMSQRPSPALVAGDPDALVQPLLDGLGAPVGPIDAQAGYALLHEIGKTLGALIRGVDALRGTQEGAQRQLLPLARTLQPIEDNPLRLGLSYPDTVRALFAVDRSMVHLSPSAAVEESLAQVLRHQRALTVAIQAGLEALLRAFSPDQLQQRFQRYRPDHTSQGEEAGWNWQMYTHYFDELSSSRQQGFEKLFWEVFEQAYDHALRAEAR